MSEPANKLNDWAALDQRSLGRLMTAIETQTPEGRSAIEELHRRNWPGLTVGLTGPPGCGKSTLAAALVRELCRRGAAVGVLAIDPSSPRTGGALLGDRVRLMESADGGRVFIRSVATRGHAGGLAAASADLVRLLCAAGYAWVLVESVGVGQGEIDIAAQTDVTVVMQAPGLGDDIQAMKHGLLEVADLLVVNKSDRPGADRLASDLATWVTNASNRVCRTNALTGEGVAALIDAIERWRDERGAAKGRSAELRREAIRRRALALFAERLDGRLRTQLPPEGDPFRAAERIVAEILKDSAL